MHDKWIYICTMATLKKEWGKKNSYIFYINTALNTFPRYSRSNFFAYFFLSQSILQLLQFPCYFQNLLLCISYCTLQFF